MDSLPSFLFATDNGRVQKRRTTKMENTKELEIKSTNECTEKDREMLKQYYFVTENAYLAPGILLGLLSFLEAAFNLGNTGYIISVVLVILSAPRFCYDIMRKMGKIDSKRDYYLTGSILSILNFVFIFLSHYHVSLLLISIVIGIFNVGFSMLYIYFAGHKGSMILAFLTFIVVLMLCLMLSNDTQQCLILVDFILLSLAFPAVYVFEEAR